MAASGEYIILLLTPFLYMVWTISSWHHRHPSFVIILTSATTSAAGPTNENQLMLVKEGSHRVRSRRRMKEEQSKTASKDKKDTSYPKNRIRVILKLSPPPPSSPSLVNLLLDDSNDVDYYSPEHEPSPQELVTQQKLRDDPGFAKKVEMAKQVGDKLGKPWTYVDWSHGRADSCGLHKCFFHARTQKDVGLLVSQGSNDYAKMKKAYAREEYLNKTYGIPRIALEEPHLVPVNKYLVAVLEAYVYHPGYDDASKQTNDKERSEEEEETYYDLKHDLILQKVVRVPEPNLMVGFSKVKSSVMEQQLPYFVFAGIGYDHMDTFVSKYQQEMNKTLTMVQDPDHFYLLHDFQMMIGTDGTFYHIDLDRSQLPRGKSKTLVKHLKEDLQDLLGAIIEELEALKPLHGNVHPADYWSNLANFPDVAWTGSN